MPMISRKAFSGGVTQRWLIHWRRHAAIPRSFRRMGPELFEPIEALRGLSFFTILVACAWCEWKAVVWLATVWT
jgi:hypothetical protein